MPYLQQRKQFGKPIGDFQGMMFQYGRVRSAMLYLLQLSGPLCCVSASLLLLQIAALQEHCCCIHAGSGAN